jgi:glycosyltransferase involved in cell wall biosynthesis
MSGASGYIPDLSFIVPVLNEEDNVDFFLQTLREQVLSVQRYEVIFVDDGSTDDTAARIRSARATFPFPVELIRLSRNFGKEAALTAGLDHARGRAVVPIDADLQHPPRIVDEMVAQWRRGYDVVLAVRNQRTEHSVLKRSSARAFYRLANRITDSAIPENAGDFRLMDARVVDAVRRLRERNRFMKGILSWPGFRVVRIGYDQAPRLHGESKWRLRKLIGFALDGVFGFSTLPLRIWTYLGLAVSASAFVYLVVIVLQKLFGGIDVPGYASLVSFMLLFNGLTLIGIGIVGEYVGRVYNEVKQRPIYVVRDSTLGADTTGAVREGEPRDAA